MFKIALAAGMASAASGVLAGPSADAVETQAHTTWKEAITHTPTPDRGCFHSSYPSTQWVRGPCFEAPHRYLTPPRKFDARTGEWQVVGNFNDYVIQTSSNIRQTVGSFPTVSNVTFETSVGTVGFGGNGILGPNEYTLQLNSQFDLPTLACQAHPGCTIWQQFVYSTDYEVKGTAAVFIEYWLVGWGNANCPSGWDSFVESITPSPTDRFNCVLNSNFVAAPDVPITQLANEKLSGSAVLGGNDTAVFTDGNTAYSLSAPDSVLSLASAWNESEFNVVGDAGASRADFNPRASVTVKIAATDGSTTAPTCVAGHGTTEETNNLTFVGGCSAAGGSTPYVEFTESNPVKL